MHDSTKDELKQICLLLLAVTAICIPLTATACAVIYVRSLVGGC